MTDKAMIESYELMLRTPNAATVRQIRITGTEFGMADIYFIRDPSGDMQSFQGSLSDSPYGDLSESMEGNYYEVRYPLGDWEAVLDMLRSESVVYFEFHEASSIVTLSTDQVFIEPYDEDDDEEAC